MNITFKNYSNLCFPVFSMFAALNITNISNTKYYYFCNFNNAL